MFNKKSNRYSVLSIDANTKTYMLSIDNLSKEDVDNIRALFVYGSNDDSLRETANDLELAKQVLEN